MKYFLYLLAGLFLYTACDTGSSTTSQPNTSITQDGDTENLNISLEVKNMPNGPVHLLGTFQGQNYRLDSAQIAGGKVTFKKNEGVKRGMYFVVFPDQSNLQLLLDKDQSLTATADGNDLLGTIRVTGNTDTESLYENMRYEGNFRAQIEPINQRIKLVGAQSPEYAPLNTQKEALLAQRKAHIQGFADKYPNSLFANFKIAGQNPEIEDSRHADGSPWPELQVYKYRNQFWDGVDFSDERLMHTPVITNKLKRYVEKLTPQDPDSIIAAADFLIQKAGANREYFKYFANFITLQYEPGKSPLMDAEKVYVHMIQKYFTNEKAFWADSTTVHGLQLKAHEMAASLTGLKGPNVSANDQNGVLRSIDDIKSDYVIVYLYNPTCEHCMVETPLLVEFYKTWKSKGVEVYSIAVDTNDAEWRAYIKKQGMNWINVFDPTNRSIYAKYYVNVTPEIYVLNPDRTIIAKNLKVEQIAQVIETDKASR